MFKFVVFGLLFLLPFAPPVQADDLVFRVCYESDANPPYMLGNFEVPAENTGILPQKIKRAAEAVGLKVQFYRSAWKRCIRDLQNNETDATFSMIWTPERDDWAVFPKTADGQVDHNLALEKVNYPVFQRASHTVWNGAAFSNVKMGIGAPIGYVAEAKLSQSGILSRMKYTPQEGLRQLAQGRLDGYVVEEKIGKYIVANIGETHRIKASSRPFMVAYWHIPFSKGFYQQYSDNAKAFWQSLAKADD
ncbi:transporter substrate-binding domain-containing protein [Aliiglaciecola sp. CAU 1673]|uniref:substrate-binding periplasmic protein n=1 Tax=Aliiglaciecola sp. CAU 1673 TaxID=3032595 RepID=UPI0023DB22B4|nr:transporter substrate-binding domain-containing protein [Aliiglaciecola sp. CAU 1673]MDF2178362.1 transporter substrate-binding domain-containing protein [Aliiglaciecola sp. CAU 1673]